MPWNGDIFKARCDTPLEPGWNYCPVCGLSANKVRCELFKIKEYTTTEDRELIKKWNEETLRRRRCPRCQVEDGRHNGVSEPCDECKLRASSTNLSQIEKNIAQGRHPYDNGRYGKKGGYRGGLRLHEIEESERKDR